MTTFPNSPRLLKGALVAIDPLRPMPTVIVFQYNPETLTRRIEARTSGGDTGGGSDRTEVLRLAGPPKETITLAAEIDGSDEVGGLHRTPGFDRFAIAAGALRLGCGAGAARASGEL